MIYTVTLNPALDRELVVQQLTFDAVLRAQASRIDYGGKGFNVSRGVVALGGDSVALGFVGGPTGQRLADGLDRAGISLDFVWLAEETRTNVSIVLADRTHYLKINEAGPVVSPYEQYALHEKIARRARAGDWWVLSGSLPQGVPPKFYAELVEVVQAAGARAVLDTGGEALRMGCEARVFLAKPNLTEAAALTALPLKTPAEIHAGLLAIHRLGAEHVLLSRGKESALLSDGQQVWEATPPPIKQRNPIGAGDAMVAGVVWALSRDNELPEALRWGVACGAAAASLDGTAMGSYDHVAQLLKDVKVEAFAAT
jgi:1-phosphofructokinase family hexose kinase